jgi:hypothetical protein
MKKFLSVLFLSTSLIAMHSAQAQISKNNIQMQDLVSHGSEVPESAIKGAVATHFHCESGNKITTYQHEGEKQSIELRWKNQLHHLVRVKTSTGANRFENQQQGLVWLGLPTKNILLDSKKGQQLANDCKKA